MRKGGKQLELPLPKATAAERRAWIRDRLNGYAFRQAAREAKRREAARRRRRKTQRFFQEEKSAPEQLPIPNFPPPA